jgi:hypothetical protein
MRHVIARRDYTPELEQGARVVLGSLLRKLADGEADPRVTRRLYAVAARFEAGVAAADDMEGGTAWN